MKSRLEHVLGIDNRCTATPHAKLLVVSDEEPATAAGGDPGYAHGCLWIYAVYGILFVNIGTSEVAQWHEVGAAD